MTLLPLLSALALAASPAPARPAPARDPAGAGKGLSRGLEARVAVLAGAFDGLGVREDSAAVAVVLARVTPFLESDRLRLELPLSARHREPFGVDLRETELEGAAGVDYRISRALRIGAEAGAAWVSRPEWPDLYQPAPSPGGGLLPTDRYGHTDLHGEVRLWASPRPRQHLRLSYRVVRADWVDDPNYDQQLNPDSLQPRDNVRHQVEGSWRVLRPGYAVALRVDYAYRDDQDVLARQAGTGSIVATNPSQELHDVEPSVEVELRRLGGRADLALRYGLEVQEDPYQGYYSYVGHHPRVTLDLAATRALDLRLRAEAWLRRYGPDSTAASRLEWGSRRQDRRLKVGAEARWALGRSLTAVVTGEWTTRSTNFPDLRPPPPEIDWDYVNLEALAGLEWSM